MARLTCNELQHEADEALRAARVTGIKADYTAAAKLEQQARDREDCV